MGVPKFYRWLSERYPLINQLISGTAILPEFDNLYLDMNGIIHACTHPNDNHAANSLTLREMMLSIFRYIDRIVTEIVKPKKVLFLAIDGVAPRAKLNQQRARRFRAAEDRAESIEKAKQRGEVVDEGNLFDSNCITPGTEFMETVHRHLKYYIRKKMKEDPIWAALTVIYSGHDVPGEGEHKIMQYIRDLRASPTYEPNVRHCMYGQDADLIMLSLTTHEPHFALLREVIQFNLPKHKKAVREVVYKQTQEAQFQLLHVSLLREYIALDFGHNMSVEMDTERIVDDFILLTFLVGNDFLPHLPTLDISEHAFDVLINAYRSLWEEQPGYIVYQGEIHDVGRFERLCSIVGRQEGEILTKRMHEKKEFQSKRASLEDIEAEEAREAALQEQFELALKAAMGGDGGKAESKGDDEAGEKEEGDWVQVTPKKTDGFFDIDTAIDEEKAEEKDHRGRYYYEKFKIVVTDPQTAGSFFGKLKYEYLQGLMWCLAYYSKGCVSWTWYYPYHYGPMLQDMAGLEPIKASIRFELGHPFTPYQQLLGCLPPLSCNLLPRCYQFLMISEDSPLRHFYPDSFDIDMDGKKNPWEAVVLLAFFDEKQLIEAEKVWCPVAKLTVTEYNRNQFGKLLQHVYDPNVTDTVLSCNPEIGLGDIHHCHSSLTELDFSLLPGKAFVPKLIDGTEYPIAGYPSLTCLPLASIEIEAQKINIFGTDSRYRSIILGLEVPEIDNIDLKKMEKMLGKVVYVNYPHMHEAKVVGISYENEEVRLVKGQAVYNKFDAVAQNRWKADSSKEVDAYLKGRSTVGTGGMFIDHIQIRVLCQVLIGMKRSSSTGESSKIYSTTIVDIPIQLVLWEPLVKDMRFIETSALPIEELYPLGVSVVATKGPLKGCVGKVVGPHTYDLVAFKQQLRNKSKGSKAAAVVKKRVVDVEFQIPLPSPAFGYHIKNSVYDEYYSVRDVCNMVNISPNVLGKIVGNITIQDKSRERFDIGLNLKRNGVYQCSGYVRKVTPTNHKSNPKDKRNVWKQTDTIDIIGLIHSENSASATGEKEQVYWEYSHKAILLIAEYQAKFPQLFNILATIEHKPVYDLPQLFPGKKKEESVDVVLQWMKEQPFYHVPRTPLTSDSLSREAMSAIERAADIYTTYIQTHGSQTLTVRSIALDHIYCGIHRTAQDMALDYNTLQAELGDRVVNLSCSAVPLGLKGTVVAIHNEGKFVDVIFDEEFMGGKSLQGACSQFRGKLCAWSDLLLLQNNPHVQTFAAPAAEVKEDHAVKHKAPVAEVKEIDTSINVSEFSYDQIMDDYDDKIDELFALQDITVIMSKLQLGDKKSDGSGYRKLLEIAGVNNTLVLGQSKQSKKPHEATNMLKSMLSVQPKGGHSGQGGQKQPLNFKSVVAGQQHSQPVKSHAAPSHDHRAAVPTPHHSQPAAAVNSVVDKQAATRMVKHHLNVPPSSAPDKSDKKPAAHAVPAPSQHASHQAKANHLMTILKKPVAAPPADANAPAADAATTAAAAPAPDAKNDNKLTSLLHKAKAQQVHGKAPHTTAQHVQVKQQEHKLPTAPGLPASTDNKLTSLLHKAKAQHSHGKASESAALPTAPGLPDASPVAVPIAPSLPASEPAALPVAPTLTTSTESGSKKGGNLTSLLSKAKAGMKAKMVEQKSHTTGHQVNVSSPSVQSASSDASHPVVNSASESSTGVVATTEAKVESADAGKKGGVSITSILANAKRVPAADAHRPHAQASHQAAPHATAHKKPHSAPSVSTTQAARAHSAGAHHAPAKSGEGKPTEELESKIKKIESERVNLPDVPDQSNSGAAPPTAPATIESAPSVPKPPVKPTFFKPTHVSAGKK